MDPLVVALEKHLIPKGTELVCDCTSWDSQNTHRWGRRESPIDPNICSSLILSSIAKAIAKQLSPWAKLPSSLNLETERLGLASYIWRPKVNFVFVIPIAKK